MRRMWRRMWRLVRSSRFDLELEEEMRQHLECRVRDAVDAGMDEAEARRAAAHRFGGALQVREASRDVWGLTWLADFLQDLRHGGRLLRRNPSFTLVAVLSLAIGIGANTAIFGLLDSVVYRSLPVRAPGDLVLFGEEASLGVWFGVERDARSLFAFDEYRSLREHQQSLSGLLAVSEAPGETAVRVGDESAAPEQATSTLVSGNYFEVLGVAPRIGRSLLASDDGAPGAHPVAVISDAYWARRFSRDPAVLGRSIRIGRVGLVVVGVAAEGFGGDHVGRPTDIWLPLALQADAMPGRDWVGNPKALWLRLVGRLKPGQRVPQATAGLNVTLRQILTARAGSLASDEARRELLDQRIALSSAATGVSRVRDRFSTSLHVIMAMVALVLLVASTNLATLVLARATARQKELGLRLALGAGRTRVLRQMLTESLLLSTLGALVGLAFARVSGYGLLRMASGGPDPVPLALTIDARLIAFTAGVTMATVLLVGVWPAWRASRSDPNAALRSSPAHDASGGHGLSGRRTLVVAQVAVTLVLLVAAGLFVTTVRNLNRADLGFDRDLLAVSVDGVQAGYRDARLIDLGRRIVSRLQRVPGVAGVTFSDNGLLSGSDSVTGIIVSGDRTRPEDERMTRFDRVAPGFFSTLAIPVVVGRELTEQDGPGAPPVAVINQSMSRHYFGESSPIGRQFLREREGRDGQAVTVVGVVRDVKELGARSEVVRRFYLPYYQAASGEELSLRLLVRLSGPLSAVRPAVRSAIREIDPTLEIFSMMTIGERADRMTARDRMTAQLAAAFGLVAVFLAATGLYGVLSYAVARRTREIGIRVALGATRTEVARLVIRDGLAMVLVGTIVGVPAACLAARAVASQLFGLQPIDPPVLVGAVASLTLVAALAAYLPARHAASVDPLSALRRE